MIARYVLGAVLAASAAAPVMASPMTADEARKFVYGKVFAFKVTGNTSGVCPECGAGTETC